MTLYEEENHMKVAIIGCGSIAVSQHIPAYMNHPKVEIKYFCDARKERQKRQ
jgi:predicted dehydrogenase